MALLDQHGNPFQMADIAAPQTAQIAQLQNQVMVSQLDGITPARAARILRQADEGDIVAQHQLFDDMLDRDSHLRCEYEKRTGALVNLDWSVVPPSDPSRAEKKAAAWCEEVLRDVVDDFESLLLAMGDAPGHGFAPVEIEWERRGSEWLPEFHPRPQTWFRLDPTRRHLRLADGSGEGAAPNPMGWIIHRSRKVKTGYGARAGLFRPAIWPFLYKAYSIGDLAEFLETYGLPIIVGKYMNGASDSEKGSLLRAVMALGHDARAIMPEGMAIEIDKVTTAGDGANHLSMVDWADRAHSKLILGQVLSAEAKATGMGSGVADLQGEVRSDILASDARQVAGTLTRDLVYALMVLNMPGVDGLRRCPRFVFDLGEADDLKLYADALPALASGGVRVPVSWVHEKLRIPEAGEGEAVFGAPAPADAPIPPIAPMPSPQAAALRAALSVALHGQPDPIDALVNAACADWQPMLEPMVDPIQAAMDASAAAGETAEQFIARLPALLATIDPTALNEQLARAAFTARLAGRAG